MGTNRFIQGDTKMIILCFVLSLIPFFIWLWVFYHKDPEDRRLTVETVLGGMISVLPLAALQAYMLKNPAWDIFAHIKSINLTGVINFFGIPGQYHEVFHRNMTWFLVFIAIAIMEELVKHWVVKYMDYRSKNFDSVDDGIEFSVIAALGFALVENTVYFFTILTMQGYAALLIPFIFRSLFSTLAHVFFSGVFGYHYGLAKFAPEEMDEKVKMGRKFFLMRFFRKYLHIRPEWIFKEEEVGDGLFLAMLFHAIFNFLLFLELTYLIVPYLAVGYWYLSYEMSLGRNKHRWSKDEQEKCAEELKILETVGRQI